MALHKEDTGKNNVTSQMSDSSLIQIMNTDKTSNEDKTLGPIKINTQGRDGSIM